MNTFSEQNKLHSCNKRPLQKRPEVIFNSLPHNPEVKGPEKEGCQKHCGKRRKSWELAFSCFPTMFSILSNT